MLLLDKHGKALELTKENQYEKDEPEQVLHMHCVHLAGLSSRRNIGQNQKKTKQRGSNYS